MKITNVTASPARTGVDRYDLRLVMHSETSYKKAPTKISKLNGTVTDLPPTINRFALESFPAAGSASVR